MSRASVGEGIRQAVPAPRQGDADAASREDLAEGQQSTTGRSLVVGGTLLTAAMLITNAGNYALNLLVGRWLPAARFADANLMVTIMLLMTAIAVSIQLVSARSASLAGSTGASRDGARVARWLERRAGLLGLVAGLVLAGGSSYWQQLLHTASPWPFVILGIGMPCYLAQAVGRGELQGRLAFGRLAATFLIEMVVRLGTGIALVSAGFGVNGATAALTASFVATWIAVRALGTGTASAVGRVPSELLRPVLLYMRLVSVLLIGQVIVNNGDVFVAKRYLPGLEAGRYAAIALVGRAVFFLSWSVATTVFPAVAARHAQGKASGSLLRGSLVAVAALGGVCSIGAMLIGGPLLSLVLGPTYRGLGPALGAYALVTTIFAIANLAATHDLSTGGVAASWAVCAGGVVQSVFLLLWNASIADLIRDQAAAMAFLALFVLAAHRWAVRPRTVEKVGAS
jgi:O-antigen/teichoic acid export membrane protein